MYCEPNIRPAPNAAATPRSACSDAEWEFETNDNNTAPTNITRAPPTTPSQRNQPARCNSLKRSVPQMIAIKLFAFHKGNAMLKPMSRTAKTVNVLPIAHRHPAITPQTIRWGTLRMSEKVPEVPSMRAGRLQRETKAPRTIMNEITKGETATVTNLVGDSAPASHSAAAKPQNIPSSWSFCCRERPVTASVVTGGFTRFAWRQSSLNGIQNQSSNGQGQQRHPEMHIVKNRPDP